MGKLYYANDCSYGGKNSDDSADHTSEKVQIII